MMPIEENALTAAQQDDATRITSNVRRYLDQVISVVDKAEIDQVWATRVYRRNREKRISPTEFVVFSDDSLHLIAEAPHSDIVDRPVGMLFFWNNYLWPTYSLTFYWGVPNRGGSISYRAYFMTDTSQLESLKHKPTRIILLRGQRCISAVDLDLEKANADIWKILDQTPPHQSLREQTGAKVFVSSHLEHNVPPQRELEFGWARRLEGHAREAIRFLRDHPDRSAQDQIIQSSPFGEAFEEGKNAAAELYEAFQECFWVRHENPLTFLRELRKTLAEALDYQVFIEMIMAGAWFSAGGTNQGKEIRSIGEKGSITSVKLTEVLPTSASKIFWSRQSLSFPFYYHQLVGSGNVGIDAEALVGTVPPYHGDVDEGEAFTNDLLAEAASLKQWTIPPGAYVQLELGDIVAAKLHEIGSEVACLLVNRIGEFALVWIEPRSQDMNIVGFFEISNVAGKHGHNEEWLRRFELSIKLLLAAIIRDFWVIEERERLFGGALLMKKGPRLQSDQGKPIIVYLPRVKYVGDVTKSSDSLDLLARRPHFVIGHLRKVLQASAAQIQTARRFGVTVPEGFTFVRPHKRGDKAQDRIYRSRSALACIRALEPVSAHTGVDHWFTYEINVKKWLMSNGFEVDHVAASRFGDGGVDIQAYRNDEHLLVQCKHWRKEKVGPNVIREMLGTLQTFPEGSRGVIITSTELTPGARVLAIEKGIEFVERIDFGVAILSKL